MKKEGKSKEGVFKFKETLNEKHRKVDQNIQGNNVSNADGKQSRENEVQVVRTTSRKGIR